jgi:hypothetical protein
MPLPPLRAVLLLLLLLVVVVVVVAGTGGQLGGAASTGGGPTEVTSSRGRPGVGLCTSRLRRPADTDAIGLGTMGN